MYSIDKRKLSIMSLCKHWSFNQASLRTNTFFMLNFMALHSAYSRPIILFEIFDITGHITINRKGVGGYSWGRVEISSSTKLNWMSIDIDNHFLPCCQSVTIYNLCIYDPYNYTSSSPETMRRYAMTSYTLINMSSFDQLFIWRSRGYTWWTQTVCILHKAKHIKNSLELLISI